VSESLGDFVDAISGAPRGSTDTWIERVRAADAEAESGYQALIEVDESDTSLDVAAAALIVIAAELRAQRIARRPGAGS